MQGVQVKIIDNDISFGIQNPLPFHCLSNWIKVEHLSGKTFNVYLNHHVAIDHIITKIGVVILQNRTFLFDPVTGIEIKLVPPWETIHKEIVTLPEFIFSIQVERIKILLVVIHRNIGNQIPVFCVEEAQALGGLPEFGRISKNFGIGVFVKLLVNVA